MGGSGVGSAGAVFGPIPGVVEGTIVITGAGGTGLRATPVGSDDELTAVAVTFSIAGASRAGFVFVGAGVERGDLRPAIGVENTVGSDAIARGRANGITFSSAALPRS